MKDSDVRYTPPEFYRELHELTGVNWRRANDATPKNHKSDSLKRRWRGNSYYLNPPFSQASSFVKKALDELSASDGPQRVLIVLPWYFVENKKHRVTSAPQWFLKARRRMRRFLVFSKKFRVRFIHPEGFQYKNPFAVYVFHLER